jgi:hypothetical protein
VGYEWIWIDKVYGVRKRVPKLDSRPIDGVPPIADLIRQGIEDKSAMVRRVIADALNEARSQLPDADSLVDKLARDRNAAVRSRADFMLRHPVVPSAASPSA